MSNLDPEQIRADIGRWKREIQNCRTRFKLTDDHPQITQWVARIQAAERLLGIDVDRAVSDTGSNPGGVDPGA